MAVFSDADSTEDVIVLAWILEEGSRRFYDGLVSMVQDKDAKALYESLVLAESGHKEILARIYRDKTGREFTPHVAGQDRSLDLMEGGTSVNDALKWAEGKSTIDLYQFSMSAEINAYDLHLKLADRMDEVAWKDVFRKLALEEETHLTRMGELLGKQF